MPLEATWQHGLQIGAHASLVVHVSGPVQVALRLPVKPATHDPTHVCPTDVGLAQLLNVPLTGPWGVLVQTASRHRSSNRMEVPR